MQTNFEENIQDIVSKTISWRCPFKRKLCKCKICLKNRVFANSGGCKKPPKPAPIIEKISHKVHNPAPQIIQYNKMKNIQKLKSLIEFNGNLLIKFSKNLKNLNSQEIIYYNKIAHENLKKLEEIVRTIAV